MSTLDELERSVERLNRAVERLKFCAAGAAALTTGEAGSPIGQNDQPGLAFSGEGVKPWPCPSQGL